MEAVIIVAVVALANIACFMIGVKTGMAVAKGEEIKLVELPRAFDFTEQREQTAEADIEQQKLDKILRNIEIYDGTSIGQEEL
jgi:hypothetical protein